MKHLMILMILFNFNRKIRVKITNILIGKRKLLYYPCTYLSTTEKRQELDHFTILNSCLGLVSTMIYFQIITVCFKLGQPLNCSVIMFIYNHGTIFLYLCYFSVVLVNFFHLFWWYSPLLCSWRTNNPPPPYF